MPADPSLHKTDQQELIDVARAQLHTHRTFHHEGGTMTIGLLIRDAGRKATRSWQLVSESLFRESNDAG